MRKFIRKVNTLNSWKPSKQEGRPSSEEVKDTLSEDINKDNNQQPSYWAVDGVEDIDKIVSGFILMSKPRQFSKVRTTKIVVFEEICFTPSPGGLILSPDVDNNFPIVSVRDKHYILSPSADNTDLILGGLLGCNGYFQEYKKKPALQEPARTIAVALESCNGDVAPEYEAIFEKLIDN
jgi:hypothetical protein